MKTTRPPCEHITLGDDGRPVKVPYEGMPETDWQDFVNCLLFAGFLGIVVLAVLMLAPR